MFYVLIVTNIQKSVFHVYSTASLIDRLRELECSDEENQCKFLVYYETYHELIVTANRELKLERYSQRKLKRLIGRSNPGWAFLNDQVFRSHSQ